MRTTIDGAGRIVIPKSVRDAAGLSAGTELEIQLREGRIEIEPATVPMRTTGPPGQVVIEADVGMPTLTADDVRNTLERTRR